MEGFCIVCNQSDCFCSSIAQCGHITEGVCDICELEETRKVRVRKIKKVVKKLLRRKNKQFLLRYGIKIKGLRLHFSYNRFLDSFCDL